MSAEAALPGPDAEPTVTVGDRLVRRAMRSSTARNGSISWVAISKAMAATAIARSATQTMEVSCFFHASP